MNEDSCMTMTDVHRDQDGGLLLDLVFTSLLPFPFHTSASHTTLSLSLLPNTLSIPFLDMSKHTDRANGAQDDSGFFSDDESPQSRRQRKTLTQQLFPKYCKDATGSEQGGDNTKDNEVQEEYRGSGSSEASVECGQYVNPLLTLELEDDMDDDLSKDADVQGSSQPAASNKGKEVIFGMALFFFFLLKHALSFCAQTWDLAFCSLFF
jgi:hypothetical protein